MSPGKDSVTVEDEGLRAVEVFDNGTGMGQVTQALMECWGNDSGFDVVAGDVESSCLKAVEERRLGEGSRCRN